MGKKLDLIGQRFGRLTVIGKDEIKNHRQYWLCRCDCGNEKIVSTHSLTKGTQSCGCLQKERASKASITHGLSKTRIHKEWRAILHRCKNETASHYEYYGGRGITVCDEWKGENGFIRFYEWAMAHGYSDNLTLDRINNDKGYSPDNCRWVTHMENCHNRGIRYDSKTGVPGVQVRKMRTGEVKYRVHITVNYKRVNIGHFDTLAEAAEARRQAELKYWGEGGDFLDSRVS